MNYEDARFGMLLILIFDGKKRTRTTQKALSEKIGLSQQSISRILRELEAQGIIYRIVEGKGEYLEITEKGL
ncbi:MAG: MarR family transcriptional regulator, partial [Fervidicoccus fontis]